MKFKKEININRLKTISSISYFQSSIKYFSKYFKGLNEPAFTSNIFNEGYTLLVDGSTVYSKVFRSKSKSER